MSADRIDEEELQPLLDRLATGDKTAINALIEWSVQVFVKRARHMLNYFPRLRRRYTTRDIAQGAAVRLMNALPEVKLSSPRDYLNLVAVQIRRELIDLSRHEYGPEGSAAHHATPPAGSRVDSWMARPRRVKHKKPGPVTEVCWHDLLEYVQRQLPAEELEVFDLHYIQDLSEEFVARILNVSVSTVKRRWRSTRLRLAKQSGLKNLLNGS